ncbi:PLP-dependent aminotransferase family protein [Terasakiella sp.]|uniref:aminotransferase-like domain-containing protein n=1 Tax=Terasakiella sp. TaxID=2034861 RepID=UPI003AA8137D
MARNINSTNLVEAIIDRISTMIESTTLKPGTRLQSIREAAKENGVSKNTMAEAYDRLVGIGYLRAKQGAGYFVIGPRRNIVPKSIPQQNEAISVISLLRQQLGRTYKVPVGDGRLPYSWIEDSEVAAFFRSPKSLRDTNLRDGYGSPMGYTPLRERITVLLSERSIHAEPSQILLTNGANHAMDLIIRHMLVPGDVVFVDEPGYYPLFGKLKLSNIKIVGIKRLVDGPDPIDFAQKANIYKPKLFFTQSLAHNPTGGSTSIATAHQILMLAEKHNILVVEDDPFADVLPPSTPRLAALDQFNRVLYIGTFSKTLSANLRVGYVAGNHDVIAALCDLKMLTVVSSSEFGERLVYNLMVNGHYVRHLRRLKKRTDKARNQALIDLEDIGAEIIVPPTGGYYIWIKNPEKYDEYQLVQAAMEHGIFLAPGSVFALEETVSPCAMRLNIAHVSNPAFLEFMADHLP